MNSLKNLDKLPSDIGQKIKDYMEELLRLHIDNILSIFIYGSAASGDFIPRVSDINSAVVFKKLEFEQFEMSLHLVNKGIKNKIAAPLFLCPEYIKTSCDTFPIEFLDMKENHILIYGEDILEGLTIDTANIRFVCEEQLKGRLIRIRQGYLEVGLHTKGMGALMKESLNSLFPIFRGMLRLKGVAPPVKKQEIIKALAGAFGIDTTAFSSIKNGTKDQQDLLQRYIEQIEHLAEISDKL